VKQLLWEAGGWTGWHWPFPASHAVTRSPITWLMNLEVLQLTSVPTSTELPLPKEGGSRFHRIIGVCLQTYTASLVASSSSCDSLLVEIKCINVRRNTTVFSNCWRNQLHVSALFRVGHHQVDTRISEKTHTTMWTSRIGERDLVLQCLGRYVAVYRMWNLRWLRLCRVLFSFDTWAGVVFGSCLYT
jgi:hypothetical protein